MPGQAEWFQLDDQLTQTFIFSVALNSVNALEPDERGIVFLATLGLTAMVVKQVHDIFERVMDSARLEQQIAIELLGHFLQIVVSLFSTAAGRYVSTVMGATIVERPVYSLAITSIIVSVLYLVKPQLGGKRNGGSGQPR